MKTARLFYGTEYFLPELAAAFDVRGILPLLQLPIQLVVFKSRAFLSAPLLPRTDEDPAVITQV
jgi:hypothetical protein